MTKEFKPRRPATTGIDSLQTPMDKKKSALTSQLPVHNTAVAAMPRGSGQPRKTVSPYQVRGNGLFRGHDRCVATARGVDIYDDENRRVATMRENELFDSDYRKIMSIRGDDIHDASDEKVGTVSGARQSLHGEGEELLIVAFWYCFVR